jgi:hypothetical protein
VTDTLVQTVTAVVAERARLQRELNEAQIQIRQVQAALGGSLVLGLTETIRAREQHRQDLIRDAGLVAAERNKAEQERDKLAAEVKELAKENASLRQELAVRSYDAQAAELKSVRLALDGAVAREKALAESLRLAQAGQSREQILKTADKGKPLALVAVYADGTVAMTKESTANRNVPSCEGPYDELRAKFKVNTLPR